MWRFFGDESEGDEDDFVEELDLYLMEVYNFDDNELLLVYIEKFVFEVVIFFEIEEVI